MEPTNDTAKVYVSEATLQGLQTHRQSLLQQRAHLAGALQETERAIAMQEGAINLMEKLLAGQAELDA